MVHAAFCVRCAPYIAGVAERRAAFKSASEYAPCKTGREILTYCADVDTGHKTTEEAAIQSVLDEVLNKRLGKLVDVEWRMDEDHDGDPCVRVRLVLSQYITDECNLAKAEIIKAIGSVTNRFVFTSVYSRRTR